MSKLKHLDLRSWFSGPELGEGMLEYGLEEFLPQGDEPDVEGSMIIEKRVKKRSFTEE